MTFSGSMSRLAWVFATRIWVIAGIFCTCFVARAQSVPKLAVLEFELGPGVSVDRRALSESIQNEARRAVPHLFVITQANIEQLLSKSGRVLSDCEGQCAVETGRLLGADVVIAGRLSFVGSKLRLSLQLYDTASGGLLWGETVDGSTIDDLLASWKPATERLLLPLTKRVARTSALGSNAQEGSIREAVPDFALSQDDVLVSFSSEPSGAVVQLDGTLLCQKTPCSKMVSIGLHEVRFEKEGWDAVVQPLKAAISTNVEVRLTRSTALLRVDTTPPSLTVGVDGKETRTPASLELAPGPHEILVTDKCWLKTGETLVLKKGEDRDLHITAEPRLAGVKVVAEDGDGNAVAARAFVDGHEIGGLPGAFKVPVCSSEFTARDNSGRRWATTLHLEPQRVTDLRVVFATDAPPNLRRRLAVSAWIAGGAAAATGGVFAVRTVLGASDWRDATTYAEWATARDKTRNSSTAAVVAASAAGVLLSTGVVLWLLSDR